MEALTADDTARLIYLVLLGSVIGGYFIVANRNQLGQTARQALLWAFIFIGAIGVAGLWEDIRDDVVPRQSVAAGEGRVEIPRRFDGHYYVTLTADGAPIEFVVDTGATDIVLSKADARKAGIDVDALRFNGIANTANGTVRTARATIDTLALGDLVDHRVPVWINEGELDGSLLGMAYLERYDSLSIQNGKMVLQR